MQNLISVQAHNGNTTHTGWQSEPAGRGTISILWTCLSTLYICIWAVNRPDLELTYSQRYPEKQSMGDRVFDTIIALTAPEYLCYQVASEFDIVRKARNWIKRQTDVEGAQQWTLSHGFLCEMSAVQMFHWTGFDNFPPGISMHEKISPGSVVRNCKALRLFQVCEYIQRHRQLPFRVSPDEIDRWNQTDMLVDLIAITQTIYLGTQCLLRAIAGLEISLLELLTLSYIPLYLVVAIL